ncbi:NAD(P)H-dependent oxidoreductase [Pararhodobacter sp.]|uniref:NADPH-dependent FMN reductase n=1 Tax=Pararhodobacter sp. TaxID=2127056 RepID=UPI002AFEA319|nr:NAD(P)H-dependent oxidoreductase [Pararhodobacter sp.]
MPKLLMVSGSTRTGSTNSKLAALAASIARDAGADVTLIDLKDYDMPLYNGDLEAESGLPDTAKRLKQVFVEHDGLFLASPEYNSSISPLLKNTLDWISRRDTPDEPALWAYKGKVAGLGAVGSGALGGLRGLVPLRMMLGNIGVTVVPSQVAISHGLSAFDERGALKDERQHGMLKATIDQLISTTRALKATR